MGESSGVEFIRAWFQRQGWTPLPFQVETWQAYWAGRSGMVQVPTGSGKTYAAVLAPLVDMLETPGVGLQLLYITPLRSLSRDIEQSIQRVITDWGGTLRVECRTGDTSSSRKGKQRRAMPDVLITTPESLAVLLSYPDSGRLFGQLRAIVLDEWHELLSSKRGTQTELNLAQLRAWQPQVRTWALSATLGNAREAAQAAVGLAADPVLIQSNLRRQTQIHSILPPDMDGFPWAGHLGLRLYEELVAALDITISTLIFTNTRSQAERWYQALAFAVDEDADRVALHHGSIDANTRQAIEAGVKSGAIKWVVCTSSLDLGVDFQPVERVVQIGSAKNLARLLQRAGRSAHVPAGTSEVFFLPTNALELLEIMAFRLGLAAGDLEARRSRSKPYDVLVQHLTTLACGDGFDPADLRHQLRQTAAYQQLTAAELDWLIQFLDSGGTCLGAYPYYQKIERQPDGRYRVSSPPIARRHRLSIGTITSNQLVYIAYTNRKRIGTVEENFVSRLKPGDVFFFAGRQLEFFQMKDMVVYVKNATKQSTVTPTWGGGNLAISDSLSRYLRQAIAQAAVDGSAALPSDRANRLPDALPKPNDADVERDREIRCLQPILQAQARLSAIPTTAELLIETCKTRDGQHLYVYPFEGRFVHEGLGFLWGYRFAQQQQATFTISVNDYGFEILAPKHYPFQELFNDQFFNTDQLAADMAAGLNISELEQRKFRGIAQVAGLVFSGYPSARKTSSQLQISSSLLYDVFKKYEPDNLLLRQARQEVLEDQLEVHRIAQTLTRLQSLQINWQVVKRPTPFGFPLFVERLGARLSNESLRDRIARLKHQWEAV